MNTKSIRLLDAVLCVDCECITTSFHNNCSVCGSTALMNMAQILGGSLEGQERTRLINMMDPRVERVIRELVQSAA